MPILVVLGAGASYDCVNEQLALNDGVKRPFQYKPPLTNALLEPRESFGGQLDRTRRAADLIVYLRARLQGGSALEHELDRVQARADAGDDVAAAQLMALRFYLREVLAGCSKEWPTAAYGATNYHWLVGRLDQWARDVGDVVVYVTFNYDTILELAMKDILRHDIKGMDDYLTHPRARLYKPHGSCNWGHIVHRTSPFDDDDRTWLMHNVAQLPPLGPIQLRHDWSSGIQGEAWVPALAVPIESKGGFVCPDHHIELLTQDLAEADRLLVIGWRAMEQHFLRLYHSHHRATLGGVVIACASAREARATTSRLIGSGPTRGHFDYDNNLTFSELVGHDTIEHLLA